MNQLSLKEKVLITIKKIGINGEGVGYYRRQAVFVDGALPGEEVEIEITEIKDKYAYGEITKIKKRSPYRIEAKCPYYGKCGGCQLQHLDYQASLVEKSNLVIDAFDRYYDGEMSNKTVILPTIGMENPWNYRNKSNLPLRHDGEKVVSGLYHKNTNHLVYVDQCLIESKAVSEIVQKVLKVLTDERVDIYNPKTRLGVVRYLIVRAFEDTKQSQVTLIVTREDRKVSKALSALSRIPEITSVNYSINNDLKSIEFFQDEVVNVSGPKAIEGKIASLRFEISPQAFFQLNTKQTEKLYQTIKELGQFKSTDKVVDCYCGIGSIGLYLASAVSEVRGIDINRSGIEDAKRFAEMNNIYNAQFYYGNIIPHLHDFSTQGFKTDVLIVDPPRKGLDLNFINYIKKSRIQKIVYVSCNPSTLAKNINHLQNDYVVKTIQTLDMFPWTSGVETICILVRK